LTDRNAIWLKEEVTMDAAEGSSSEAADARLGERANIFGSVLVGIDGSPEALEACGVKKLGSPWQVGTVVDRLHRRCGC
jgi:hypothetical protein